MPILLRSSGVAVVSCLLFVGLVLVVRVRVCVAQTAFISFDLDAADDNDCINISIAKSGVASLLEFVFIVCLSTVLFGLAIAVSAGISKSILDCAFANAGYDLTRHFFVFGLWFLCYGLSWDAGACSGCSRRRRFC